MPNGRKAMKVLKPGRKQAGWAIVKLCTGKGNGGGGCGAKLQVDEADLIRTGHHCYDGSSDYFVTFKCISCGVLTDLEEKEYKGDIWKLASGPGGGESRG